MKKILIYGDSNVWGDNFFSGQRIPDDKQWVNILRKKLGDNYLIFQEGLPGRLAGSKDKDKPFKNGQSTYISTFKTNAPVDMVIIALGTNDLQLKYNSTSQEVIDSLLWYQEVTREIFQDLEDRKKYFVKETMTEFLYILPINFDYEGGAKGIFNKESEQKRQEIITYFKNNNIKCIISNDMELFEDGLHLNYEGHKKQAALVEGVILENE